MKKLLTLVFIFLLGGVMLKAQGPPPNPPSTANNGGSNGYVGGPSGPSAPIGNGTAILLALALGYGIKKAKKPLNKA